MPEAAWSAIAVSLLPGSLFLAGLYFLDVYRLLSVRRVLMAALWGVLSAIMLMPVNTAAHAVWGPAFLRFGAPPLEEFVKASMLLFWITRNRVGFLVDSSILGFAIGTGFSLVENLVYLQSILEGNLLLWAVRGCGTAIMHGVATACVGTMAFALSGSRRSRLQQFAIAFLPSVALHIFFNSGMMSPTAMAQLMILASVVLMILIFLLSERMLASWLNAGLSQDIEVWDMLQTGSLETTEAGRYLSRLRTCFPPDQAQDLFRLIRIHIELRTQAKGEMILRQHGVPIEPDPSLPAKVRRLEELQRSVGLAGRRALAPLLGSGGRTVWEIQRLKEK